MRTTTITEALHFYVTALAEDSPCSLNQVSQRFELDAAEESVLDALLDTLKLFPSSFSGTGR